MKSQKNHNKTLRKAIAAEMSAIYQILQDVNGTQAAPEYAYMPEIEECTADCLDFEMADAIFADR